MSEVEIYMYDISNGMARVMGPMFGVNLEAIWHTSVVVFGYEYFFAGGGGILKEEPGTTPFGRPVQKRVLGRTRKTRVEFEDWNRGRGDEFGPDSYNLIENNCNHYTEKALRELVGVGVPDTVSGMTGAIVNSPLGQIAMNFLEQIQNNLQTSASGRTAAEEVLTTEEEEAYWCHMCDKGVEIDVVTSQKICKECKGEFIEVLERDNNVNPQSRSASPPPSSVGGQQTGIPEPSEFVQNIIGTLGRGLAELLQRIPQTPQTRRTPDPVINSLPRTTLPDGSSDPCGICLDTFAPNAEVIFLPCNHSFHTGCIEQWLRLRGNCPECRREVHGET